MKDPEIEISSFVQTYSFAEGGGVEFRPRDWKGIDLGVHKHERETMG